MSFEVFNLTYAEWKARVTGDSLPYAHVYAGAAETSGSHLFVYIYAGAQETILYSSLISGSLDETDWYSSFEGTSSLFTSTDDAISSFQINDFTTAQLISATSLPLPTGAATAALQTQPGVDIGDVTINNASGAGAVNIQDGGNSITVDGTVAATQSGTWTVQPGNTANTSPWLVSIHDGTTKATVRELGANDALNVAMVDGSGNQVTSFGGGTQYTEDAPSAADPVGTTPILVRKDTPAAIVSADGDNVAQRGTNYGAAYVQIITSSGTFVDAFSGGTQYTEDAPSAADPIGTMGMAVRSDSLVAITSADGDNIALRATNKGELYIKQVDPVPVTDNGGSLTVDGPLTDAQLRATAVPIAQPDVVGTLAALGALNAVATIELTGRTSAGFLLSAGTLVGTIVPEVSFDGGTTWVQSFFDNPTTGLTSASVVFAVANTATSLSIALSGGASNARVRVSAFTGGTANCTLRASMVQDPTALIGSWLGSSAPTVGQKVMAESIPVVFPSNQVISVQAAAANAVTGVTSGKTLQTVGAGVIFPIRSTVYTEPTANFTGSIISGSASDAAAGVGARTVVITYYTSAGVGPLTETVTLNGLTSVPLVNSDKCFIESMEVLTKGSTGWNVGVITLRDNAVATVGSIGRGNTADSPANVGDNKTLWAHHYIAAGKTASLYTLTVGTNGNQIAIMHLRRLYPLLPNATEIPIADFRQCGNNGQDSFRQFSNAVVVTGFARVTLYCVSNGTNTNFFGAFDWSEVST